MCPRHPICKQRHSCSNINHTGAKYSAVQPRIIFYEDNVGSANFLYHSKEVNLECGFLLEGDAVTPVALLFEAVVRALSGKL